jgi:hypothetical protein
MDVVSHRDRDFFHKHNFKHEMILLLFFVLVIIGYYEITISLDLDFDVGH